MGKVSVDGANYCAPKKPDHRRHGLIVELYCTTRGFNRSLPPPALYDPGSAMLIAQILSARLRALLATQGALVARRPLPFIILPLILTTVLSYGFAFLQKLTNDKDPLQLYIPNQGLSKTGGNRVVELFGDSFESELDPINGFTYVLLLKRPNDTDILTNEFVTEYLWLRQTLESLTIEIDDKWLSYSDICWKNPIWLIRTCVPDLFNVVTERGIQGYRDIRLMQYPRAKLQPHGYPFPVSVRMPLGGVTTTRQNFIRNASVAMMTFVFPYQSKEAAELWEDQMRRVLGRWRLPSVELTWFSMQQFLRDFATVSALLKELIPSLMMVIIVFCVAACCVPDWVHSKPYLALAGVVSAIVSCISGFGLALLMQVPLVDIAFVAPFLVLSIGVDDMFLMLAAWRKTSCQLSVEERLSQTFADAAVSITITSLTDVLSFAIGAFSAFPAVRFFCIYTVTSLFFTYLYQITLFGAFMTYSGRREAQNRHCFLLTKLQTSAEAEGRGMIFKVFCTGGDGRLVDDCMSSIDGTASVVQAAACSPISPKDNVFDLFFQRYYAPLLRLRAVQVLAGLSYLFYLLMAVWGATTVQIGINYAELLPDGSTSQVYLKQYGEYLHETSTAPLELVLPSMDLSRSTNQQKAFQIVEAMEYGPFTAKADFWLLEFLPYKDNRIGSTYSDFYQIMREFVQHPLYRKYAPHMRFNITERSVTSRVLIDTHSISYGQERTFLDWVKLMLADSSLNATAFHAAFQLGEQQAAVLPAMLQTVGAATGAMLLVSFLLIPKAACSVCLAACIISTNLGVLGAMSLWGVRLDIVSMITVLMSIGISVDFVAHVSYFYVQALELDLPVSKAQRALAYLGLPILQGAVSTVCGMLVLLAIRAYMIKAFVKTLLLVILFGLYHGLLLLPIVLSLFISERSRPNPQSSPASRDGRSFGKPEIASVSSFGRRAPGTATTSLPESVIVEGGVVSTKSSLRAFTPNGLRTTNKREVKNVSGGAPKQPATAKLPSDRELSRTSKVLSWLFVHLDAIQQYPAYSSSTIHQNVS